MVGGAVGGTVVAGRVVVVAGLTVVGVTGRVVDVDRTVVTVTGRVVDGPPCPPPPATVVDATPVDDPGGGDVLDELELDGRSVEADASSEADGLVDVDSVDSGSGSTAVTDDEVVSPAHASRTSGTTAIAHNLTSSDLTNMIPHPFLLRKKTL